MTTVDPSSHEWDFISPARTVTEADVIEFATLCGDWMPSHVDAEAAAAGIFGARVAHGPYVVSLAMGLLSRVPAFYEQFGAVLKLTSTARSPVYLGDTVHARAVVKQELADQVTLEFEVLTSDERLTSYGTFEFARNEEDRT